MPVELLVVQNWGKMAHLPLPTTGTFLKISYNIPLLSVMTLHYNRLYQISSLEANFSSKDMKQLCRQTEATFLHRYTYPKTNMSLIYSSNGKNSSEHIFICPEIPLWELCLMLQRLNQPTLSVHQLCMLTPDSQTALVNITYYIFLSSKHLRLFFKTRLFQY